MSVSMNRAFLLPTWAIAEREFKGFFRSPGRWIGSLGTPLILWAILAVGFRSTAFEALGTEADGFFAYFFPGTVLLAVVFSAIFSAISLIEDRRAGFLQGVLVSSAPRLSIVLGKVIGGVGIAAVQAVVLFALAPMAGVQWNLSRLVLAFLSLNLVAAVFSAFSFILAWRSESVQSFHSIMNFVLLPMWLLSGAFFAPDGSPVLVRWLIYLNPLHYGYALFASFVSSGELMELGSQTAARDAGLCGLFLGVFLLVAKREVERVGVARKGKM